MDLAAAAPAHVPWALVAQSRSGSTWVNHVLATHPCVVSANELLMSNSTAHRLFHGNLSEVSRVLDDVRDSTRTQARLRRQCAHTAGGIKLKLAERDITFGSDGNSARVVQALVLGGWRVILLHRSNYLDHMLGFLSRRRTGVLHCHTDQCDPQTLNTSLRVGCELARHSIDRLRLRSRATEMLFAGSALASSPHFVRLDYDVLVRQPAEWRRLLVLLGLPASDACGLRDGYVTKRVQQTQREMISNWKELERCMRAMGAPYARHLRPDVRPTSGRLPSNDVMCGIRPDDEAFPATSTRRRRGFSVVAWVWDAARRAIGLGGQAAHPSPGRRGDSRSPESG